MVRKCRGITDISVMEMANLGVKTRTRKRTRTRTRARSASSHETVKKRKLSDGEMRISSSYIQLRSRRITLQNSSLRTVSPSSDQDDRVSVSCCSSNGSSQEVNKRIKCMDLKDEEETSTYYSCREERRETTPSSEFRDSESFDLDSTIKKPSTAEEANSRRGSTVEKMPTQSELDEFFSTAENKLQKQFTHKYNYDIVKDKPIEGSYEWVRLKP